LVNTRSLQNWSGTATNPSYNWPVITEFVGNERADQLARIGSEHPFTGPEPACSISIGVAKKAVTDWMNRNKKKTHTGKP
jgi:hypothetical protein